MYCEKLLPIKGNTEHSLTKAYKKNSTLWIKLLLATFRLKSRTHIAYMHNPVFSIAKLSNSRKQMLESIDPKDKRMDQENKTNGINYTRWHNMENFLEKRPDSSLHSHQLLYYAMR